MRAHEFVTEKKRKRKKPRWAAYGPGPYGGYGYAVGYSGDGGVDGGVGESITEKECDWHVSPSGRKTNMCPDDDDYEINYGSDGLAKENFADGKVKGKSRPGRVKRSGASCNGSVTDLRKRAKNASGEKAKMYHWCANMKSGRDK